MNHEITFCVDNRESHLDDAVDWEYTDNGRRVVDGRYATIIYDHRYVSVHVKNHPYGEHWPYRYGTLRPLDESNLEQFEVGDVVHALVAVWDTIDEIQTIIGISQVMFVSNDRKLVEGSISKAMNLKASPWVRNDENLLRVLYIQSFVVEP